MTTHTPGPAVKARILVEGRAGSTPGPAPPGRRVSAQQLAELMSGQLAIPEAPMPVTPAVNTAPTPATPAVNTTIPTSTIPESYDGLLYKTQW